MKNALAFCLLLVSLHLPANELNPFAWDHSPEKSVLTNTVLKLSRSYPSASFQFIKNAEPADLEAFYKLTLRPKDAENIHYIVKSIAKCSYPSLLLRKRDMDRRGDSIRHVHPLRFLGYIFGDPQRKHYMHMIKKSMIKWSQFKAGLYPGLKREYNNHNLMPYLPAFAQIVDMDEKVLSHYIRKQDWEGFVHALF